MISAALIEIISTRFMCVGGAFVVMETGTVTNAVDDVFLALNEFSLLTLLETR